MANLSGIQLKDYVVTERLGSGSYGNVFKAHKKTGARDVVAVKCIVKKHLKSHEVDNLVSEIKMLKDLKHQFIVDMKDFSWDSNYIYIIMEYCGGGDLSRYIKTKNALSENVCRRFLQQLAAALKFLRSKNISHMDLKPQNILLSSKQVPVLKLADFGFAQNFSSEETHSTIMGSPLYMAPEILLKKEYSAKVDLWSIGVILFECLFGKAPYKSGSLEELIAKIKDEKPVDIPPEPKLSDECRHFLQRCLERNPSKRIDFQEFFNHPFLDLEHMPSEESSLKALTLIENAVAKDRAGLLKDALEDYKSSLEYFVPLLLAETNSTKRQTLRKRIDQYVQRAEEIKREISPHSELTQLSLCESKTDQLLKLSSKTPQLKLGIEIAITAEQYDYEGQYKVAFEKYERALGILVTQLKLEPKGNRKNLLHYELTRWMGRAEAIKEFLCVQEQAWGQLDGSDSVDGSFKDKCIIQ